MPTLGRRHIGGSNRERKTDGEDTALPASVAVSDYRAAMKMHDMPDDRQSEAHSALASVIAGSLPETIENIFERILVDSHAIVSNDNFEMRVNSLEAHLHLAAAGRELDGVGHQVPHRLL